MLLVAGLIVLLAPVGLAGCEDESSLPILGVRLADDETVTATMPCATDVRVLVEETTDQVRMRFKGTQAAASERCTIDVELDDPLGSRLLVDGRDGRAWRDVEDDLRIVRLAGCRSPSCEVDWSLDDEASACDPASFLLASIGTVVGARGDSVVVVRRCARDDAVVAIDATPYVWARVGKAWLVRSTLQAACELRTSAAPVTDADCALLEGA